MKFATVFGASFSNRRATMFPWEVSKIAYVPTARLMPSPSLPAHRTRGGLRRATSGAGGNLAPGGLAWPSRGPDGVLVFALLPALFLAQFSDVCGVMLPVPLVEEEQPVNGALAVLR